MAGYAVSEGEGRIDFYPSNNLMDTIYDEIVPSLRKHDVILLQNKPETRPGGNIILIHPDSDFDVMGRELFREIYKTRYPGVKGEMLNIHTDKFYLAVREPILDKLSEAWGRYIEKLPVREAGLEGL